MTADEAIAVLLINVSHATREYRATDQAVDVLAKAIAALSNLIYWGENFHALVVGECGSAWMEGDHNAEKFDDALAQARAALQPVP